ncbi:MAG: outer membrane protein transport protein [Roseicyclus sp.]|nr:outer membrane protein transport protein [Roseicyclus sp.]
MNRIAAASAALLATTALAQAGGIDRGVSTTRMLFEEGTYVELGYTFARPEVTGSVIGAGIPSGDMAASFGFGSFGYHQDLTEQLSFTFVIDQPYGANVAYPAGGLYPFRASTAEISTVQMTAAMRYEFTDNISVYGGIRALQADASAYVSVLAPAPAAAQFAYQLSAESDWGLGYMVGTAYEIPEIALRLAITYFSEVDLDFTGVENPAAAGTPAGSVVTSPTAFSVTMPDSILIEAQSGIAEDTLLFGSVRWTDWSEFDATPLRYPPGALIDYDNDVWTWTLGVGRRINDNLSLSATVGFEAEQGGFSANLGPTDGVTSVGLGAEYTIDNVSIAGGVQYSWIGNAVTEGATGPLGLFEDNSAVAAGIRIGFQF